MLLSSQSHVLLSETPLCTTDPCFLGCKSKAGCHLYGHLRVSDFLPVGLPQEGEITARGVESESSDEECAGSANISRVWDSRPDDEQEEIPLGSDFVMHDFQ